MSAEMVTASQRPNQDWTLDQLAAYALERVATIRGFAKKTVEEAYLFGESLFYVKQIKKEGKDWVRCVGSDKHAYQFRSYYVPGLRRPAHDEIGTMLWAGSGLLILTAIQW